MIDVTPFINVSSTSGIMKMFTITHIVILADVIGGNFYDDSGLVNYGQRITSVLVCANLTNTVDGQAYDTTKMGVPGNNRYYDGTNGRLYFASVALNVGQRYTWQVWYQ